MLHRREVLLFTLIQHSPATPVPVFQPACLVRCGAGEPADGSDGADVVLVVDPSLENLVHLHARKQYNAPKGANANPAAGSGGPKANR